MIFVHHSLPALLPTACVHGRMSILLACVGLCEALWCKTCLLNKCYINQLNLKLDKE